MDEWAAVEAGSVQSRGRAAWGPVETVSLSESGFERIYQGTAVLIVWSVDLEPGGECELSATLTLARR